MRGTRRRFWQFMLASFGLGVVAGMVILVKMQDSAVTLRPAGSTPRTATRGDGTAAVTPPVTRTSADHAIIEPAPTPAASPSDVDHAMEDLRRRDLIVPVQGVTRDVLRDSFEDTRERTRAHEALDILAPRGTPVLAVEDGVVAKLFTSVRGGLTIYQFDPSRTYAYYYAHLDRYAPKLAEGDRLTRGQTIGFVGTTGNAPANTPHLHFSIFLLTAQKQWWQGTAVNPYRALRK